MSEKRTGDRGTVEYAQEIPTMQKVVTIEQELTRGQTLAPMQPIPQNQPATSQPTTGGPAQPATTPAKPAGE